MNAIKAPHLVTLSALFLALIFLFDVAAVIGGVTDSTHAGKIELGDEPCILDFTTLPRAEDTTLSIMGEAGRLFTVTNTTTDLFLGAGILQEVDDYCSGMAQLELNEPVVAGDMLLLEGDDGTFEKVIVEPFLPYQNDFINGIVYTELDGAWVPQDEAFIVLEGTEDDFYSETISFFDGFYEFWVESGFTYQLSACYVIDDVVYYDTDEVTAPAEVNFFMEPSPEQECQFEPPEPMEPADLTISNPIMLSTSDSESWIVGVTISNESSIEIDYPFWVDVFIDPPIALDESIDINFTNGWREVEGLAAGASQALTMTASIDMPLTGLHQVYAMVDSEHEINETDELNNISGPVTVETSDSQTNLLAIYALAFDNPSYNGTNLIPQLPQALDGMLEVTRQDPSKIAVILLDLDQEGDTHIQVIYNGQVEYIPGLPNEAGELEEALNEYDMGDGATLGGFLKWARQRYPIAQTTFSYIGHGAPLVPETDIAQIFGDQRTQGGDDGVVVLPSWLHAHPDLSDVHPISMISPYDLGYALNVATEGGANPIEMVDLVHCFALSVEEVYELAPYTKSVTGSPNYAYYDAQMSVQAFQALSGEMNASQMAQALIHEYNTVLPEQKHPRLLVALNTDELPAIKQNWDITASHLLQAFELDEQGTKDKIKAAYNQSAKYDTTYCQPDWQLAPPDALSDMADFANKLSQQFGITSEVGTSAAETAQLIDQAIITTHRRAGQPWFARDESAPVWEFPGSGLALYTDFEPTIINGTPYLNWQAGWYTDTVSLNNPHPYRFIEDQGNGHSWADVFARFWQGQEFETNACLLTFAPTGMKGELSISEIIWPQAGTVEREMPLRLAATIHTTSTLEHAEVQFIVFQNDTVLFQETVGTGVLFTGTHFISTKQFWNPKQEGAFRLDVIIDPEEFIEEGDENNNSKRLEDIIQPASPNNPTVISSSLADNRQWITNLVPTLELTPAQKESLEQLAIQLYQFDDLESGIGSASQIQTQNLAASEEVEITLPNSTKPGAVLLHVWGKSNGRNSIQPVSTSFNYIPPNAAIAKDELTCYPFSAKSSDNIQISLNVPETDNANVFVWHPYNYGTPNLIGTRQGDDQLLIDSAPISGQYLLCVRGESTAGTTYTLSVVHNGASQFIHPTSSQNNQNAYIPPQRPFFQSLQPEAPKAAGITHSIYLPLTRR